MCKTGYAVFLCMCARSYLTGFCLYFGKDYPNVKPPVNSGKTV